MTILVTVCVLCDTQYFAYYYMYKQLSSMHISSPVCYIPFYPSAWVVQRGLLGVKENNTERYKNICVCVFVCDLKPPMCVSLPASFSVGIACCVGFKL